MGSKKTTTQTTNQTQTAAPPKWTLPGLEIAGQMVTDQLKATAPGTPYQGDFVAAMDADRVRQQMGMLDAAAGRMGQVSDTVFNRFNDFYTPRDSSALLKDALNAAMEPAMRRLQEEILPGITNSALMSGAYTNDRALGVVPQTAIRDSMDEAQRVMAQLAYAGFQEDENRRVQMAGLMPSLANLVGQMSTAPADILGAGTALDQQLRQELINNELGKHEYSVRAPYERIAPAAELLALLSQNWGTQTLDGKTKTVEKTGGLGQVLQGALGVASMLGSMGAFGPIGMAAGAAGGAAGGLASAANSMGFPSGAISNIFRGG